MGRNFLFFFFFWCSRCFCHLGPKMPQNPWKNTKKQKVSPHVTRPASPQTFSMGRNFMFFLRNTSKEEWNFNYFPNIWNKATTIYCNLNSGCVYFCIYVLIITWGLYTLSLEIICTR
jgi:hypothetical protein